MARTSQRKPLRERVAERQRRERGNLPGDDERIKRRKRLRHVATGLQSASIFALLLYLLIKVDDGFQNVNEPFLAVASLLFIVGRGMHVWLYLGRQ
ncbi:MAG: hypothetical protein AAGF15_06415 [Pseudomonadota bacterium]